MTISVLRSLEEWYDVERPFDILVDRIHPRRLVVEDL